MECVSHFVACTSNVHGSQGYDLATGLFLFCGNFANVLIAAGVGSPVIFGLMRLTDLADRRARLLLLPVGPPAFERPTPRRPFLDPGVKRRQRWHQA